MSGSRQQENNQSSFRQVATHLTYSMMATFMAQPFRVLLNRASMYQSPIETISGSWRFLYSGVGINVTRGTLATGLQSYTKTYAQQQGGFLAGLFASTIAGTLVASFVETPFMRKTLIKDNDLSMRMLFRFSPVLSSFYFMREAGFCVAVLAKNDLPPGMQTAALFTATWLTATCHRFAALEATRDRLAPGETIPDFRKGIGSSIRAMALGDVYTHPAFKVPFPQPKMPWTQAANLLHVSCGANMFVFRLAYLYVFREAYHLASEGKLTSKLNLFKPRWEVKDDEKPRSSPGNRM